MPQDSTGRCICRCHRDGRGFTMHIRACCRFSNEKFISAEGVVDEDRYHKLVAADEAERMAYLRKHGLKKWT